MRIGINGQSLEGSRTGVGRVLFNVLKNWSQNDKDEFIIYFQKKIPADLPKSDNFKTKITNQKSSLVFNQWSLPKTAKRDGVEVLFCPAYQKPLFFKIKTVLIIHDIIYEAHPEWYNWNGILEKIIFKYIFKQSAKKANKIICPSQSTKKEIKKFYRVSDNKIKVFYAAADDFFRPIEINPQEKERFGIKNRFILMVGSIFIRRHPREVVEAFTQFAKENSDWQFLIVGRDYTQFNLKEIVEFANNHLGRNVILHKDFINNDDDLRALYNLADFSIYLSDYEGFGLPVVESMQCGTPVITSDKSSLGEISSGAALTIKDNSSVNQIKEAFDVLANNSSKNRELKELGLRRAENFSWQKFSQGVLQEIKNV